MNWKAFGKRLLFPHPAITAVLSITAALLLIYSFAVLKETNLISIAAYAIAFYALVLICLRIPDIIRMIARFRRENAYYLRYTEDVQLRINLSLYGSCCINATYAVLQLCLGLWHASAWFYAMAGYYLLLAIMRLTLVRHTRSHAPGEDNALEWRKYRLCGACLLVMNLLLTVFILYFVFRIRVIQHHQITTIAMAAYSFTALTLAIINVIRYRRYGSPAYSAAKDISLVAATVSMLTLENAMLTAFGEEGGELLHQVLLGVSGIAVILIVQGIATFMIVKANRALQGTAETKTKRTKLQKRS